MARINFVARCDDLGSSASANRAIDAVTRAGFMKNVSVMAPGRFVEQAAELLAGRKELCFGMHTTLNAEWDEVKWPPVLPFDAGSGLTDERGYFLADPAMFERTKPSVETIMKEADAQLERLHAAGFDIRYVDSHMFPEMFVAGMDEAMAEFAKKKGLIDHMYFYNPPPGLSDIRMELPEIMGLLKALPDGQYFFVAHPSLDTEEMRRAGNALYRGADVAKWRAHETQALSNPGLCAMLRGMGCEGVRYDEATPQKRATIAEIRQLF
ncbi:MAG: ChbG/HpnK family deacetylase [Clostridiales Family XIII bacterium]|jgi:hypothetical protein|nr:ChbG/HpnK family deacetylase [Clostridiales Family XIII bacterium]